MPKAVLTLFACAFACGATAALAAPPMVIVDEAKVMRDEPPPHGAIGMSTAWRITDGVPGRTMEFRKRALHVGAAIGLHPIAHDEIYYAVSGTSPRTCKNSLIVNSLFYCSGGTTLTSTRRLSAWLYGSLGSAGLSHALPSTTNLFGSNLNFSIKAALTASALSKLSCFTAA